MRLGSKFLRLLWEWLLLNLRDSFRRLQYWRKDYLRAASIWAYTIATYWQQPELNACEGYVLSAPLMHIKGEISSLWLLSGNLAFCPAEKKILWQWLLAIIIFSPKNVYSQTVITSLLYCHREGSDGFLRLLKKIFIILIIKSSRMDANTSILVMA